MRAPRTRLAAAALALALAVLLHAVPARAIEIKSVTSPKGITAWLIQDATVPLVSMEFSFRGGSSRDPEGKGGLAEMGAGLLTQGAGPHDSTAFQGLLASESIHLGFWAGRDAVGGSLRALNDNRERAVDLLRLALAEPRFDPEPTGRVRSQLIASVLRELERPGTVADRAWHRAVFPGHPYARDVQGNLQTIPKITRADLEAWVERQFARDNLIVGVVGDISPEALAPLLDRAFGHLPEKAAVAPVPDAAPQAQGEVMVVQRPIPQTVVQFGQRGVPIEDPDYYAAVLMNYIMGGGGLTSRLATEIREKRGLAYSVNTRIVNYDHAALLMGWVSTQNARVKESLDLIRAEWRRMATAPVSEAELADAKNYIKGSFFTGLTSSGRIAQVLVGLQRDRRPIDYLEKRNALIDAVSAEDVARVAKRLLDADALTVVMVGDPEGVTATP